MKLIYKKLRLECKTHFTSTPLQGTLTAIRDWFRDYKIPDGKPANRFGLGNKPANKVSFLLFFADQLVFLLLLPSTGMNSCDLCYLSINFLSSINPVTMIAIVIFDVIL